MSDTPFIQQIRTASRLMVRELGFMNTTLAATHYSPSAVHTLLEVSVRGTITAAQLVTLLGLEKSSVSRMVARLLAAGELEERPCAEDARSKSLALTAKGHDTVATINAYGTRRVVEALAHLDETQQRTVASGLAAYAQALAQCRDAALAETTPQISLVTGYQPGAIGRIAQMHGEYYARNHDFGAFFEGKVASGVAEFTTRLSSPVNQIWLAMREGKIVGSVAIDGEDLGQQQAHLRWFILDDSCRGTGIGRRLLSEAMAFCDSRQFSAVQLWTFKGLDAARKLYESFGFTLTREWQGDQWGKMMTEQQFTRPGNAG
ncbi:MULTISPECIES: bifunctional helix-turn-helix transcriptional regulator/GNAT family N-acetyltransferase [Klebsiella]|uniref:bifunctional helix-turn-helix transcriptional regulator/GNAT family N-acetyltransferase n=1 Tax=Klebsiella TaxID=570 RepID=UPI000B40805D|nr:helix-turn-helix domain-containing GNAT family N-acetyltransferase [Klebsiella quasipneumoniae]OVX21659.1 MarR family transcriptional regulator [Klebsiella quasipneumoniae subsp. similipneumoniae]GKP87908.1 MarR family transcriptional regulator [Klebsiella quasipneumoniae]HBT6082948.1 MarR family transcriptional regulator [Klebsiella quasipneumoniae]HBT6124591.1 MarR family transcriptional regulator [Klebsiella quasipneumoniae]HBT6222131.1 MarR family transcriptional regulator [Klebsiella q